MIRAPSAVRNPFYLMFPERAQVPMLFLAAMARNAGSAAAFFKLPPNRVVEPGGQIEIRSPATPRGVDSACRL